MGAIHLKRRHVQIWQVSAKVGWLVPWMVVEAIDGVVTERNLHTTTTTAMRTRGGLELKQNGHHMETKSMPFLSQHTNRHIHRHKQTHTQTHTTQTQTQTQTHRHKHTDTNTDTQTHTHTTLVAGETSVERFSRE